MATMPRLRVHNPRKSNKQKKAAAPKLSRLTKPENLSLEEWQIELRRQFGRDQKFRLRNLGAEPFFSEFEVTNPENSNTYRVLIRGDQPGDNYCSCADFATNTLGTCKHIEFTLATLERKRGGKSALRARYEPENTEIYLHYGTRREVRLRLGKSCPPELARLAGDFFDQDGVLLENAFAQFDTFMGKAAVMDPEMRCADDVLGFVAEIRDAQNREARIREMFPRGIRSAAFRNLVKVPLYDYQAEGALFAARAGRCLIGDEMGLGKTIQAIAAAEIMAQLFGVQRVLIVCPTSLKHQWEREIERFTARNPQVIGGQRPERELGFQTNSFFKILNYDTIHRDLDLIEKWAPDLVILDEAQRIKNWNTRVARSVKKINSAYAIVLTGTPLENRLEELISIVQFVDRFRLGPTFKLLHEHQLRDEVGKVIGYQKLDQIGASLEPILIRRKKDKVLEQLPGRLDKNFFVPMTDQQMKFHTDNKELVSQVVQKWRKFKFLTEADQRRLMIGLQNMRMSCDSTYLLDHVSDHGSKADELLTLLEEVLETPGTKVVVFSQWVRMLELAERRLRAKGWDHVLFHGGVPGKHRKALVDRFRDDPDCRVFLSTDAGGVGLNLQFASVVVNLDLPWNPAILEQRIGRVHRLGQQRPVQVVNFVSQGTIEHGMLSVLSFKKSLFTGVLDDGAKEVFLGGSRLNKFLETVDKATASIPAHANEDVQRPHEQNGKAERRERTVEPDVDAPTPAPSDALSALLQAGLTFIQQATAPSKAASNSTLPKPIVERDPKTGESYLKLKMPPPEVIDQGLQMLGRFLKSLKG